MTSKSTRSGIPPIIRKPPIAEDLDKLREKPPRSSNREPLSRLERMAILDGLCDGDGPSRIAAQWNISVRTIRQFKSRLFDDPLSTTLLVNRQTEKARCTRQAQHAFRALLREVFRACGDKDHPDWEEYDRAMMDQDAVVVLVPPDRVYGRVR